MKLDFNEDELQTMLLALKIVKHFVPSEYNKEHKELYDKFRTLVGETIKFNITKDANE